MWWKWFPWKFLVRNAARRHGFIDPIKIMSQLENFMQPSEVAAPTELIRSGVVLHARGLMNSLAIQHNLDWVWPFWVECQYDPHNEAFVPRSFSLTQINLTHRNWTALGVPDGIEFPLIDPRGLITPFYDSWSLDIWIVPYEGEALIPSRCLNVSQRMMLNDNISIITTSQFDDLKIQATASVIGSALAPICQVKVIGSSSKKARLVVTLRPYNPEGVSFIHAISLLEDTMGWHINNEHFVYLDKAPNYSLCSDYQRGDVYSRLVSNEIEKDVTCKVGMASAALIYLLDAGQAQELTISIPLSKEKVKKDFGLTHEQEAQLAWQKTVKGTCVLEIPDKHFQFLYEAAIYTMVLHSPKEVYPGPFIYRRFWFRDAAFILYALLCVGFKARVHRSLECFRTRQTMQGYFLSQEGEWDSNGEALWIMRHYCEMTGSKPPEEWKESINKAAKWIMKKRLATHLQVPHAGLLPSGFSAEHLGPNDFYYWDDFWSIAGLQAAAFLSKALEDHDMASLCEEQALSLKESIDQSLVKVSERLQRPAIPASPYRRMDTGAIGSIVASYPLRVYGTNDPRILDTADFLTKNCLVHDGFFHDMTHSGINPYLTLHLAQVLLRAGNPEYFRLMTAVAKLASPTGQWPESVHPRTGGGCMGDGQHVWAAAEWVLMIRNCFVREEEGLLILCSGIPQAWLDKNQPMFFGPALTQFGEISISIKPLGQDVLVEWTGKWLIQEPLIDIRLQGFTPVRVKAGTQSLELKYQASS